MKVMKVIPLLQKVFVIEDPLKSPYRDPRKEVFEIDITFITSITGVALTIT